MKLYNVRVKILVVLHSNALISANSSYNKFKYIMKAVSILSNIIITLDGEALDEGDLSSSSGFRL